MHRRIGKERERERERGERERCMCVCVCVCVCVFRISSFYFNSENLPTYFKVSCRSLQKIIIVRDVLEHKLEVGICADGKCSDSSVVRD